MDAYSWFDQLADGLKSASNLQSGTHALRRRNVADFALTIVLKVNATHSRHVDLLLLLGVVFKGKHCDFFFEQWFV
jgi:hypothetical protein